MEKKDAIVTEMNFGYDDEQITIQKLPESVATNEELYNKIDELRKEDGDQIPAIIELLRNAGASYFIIWTGGEYTTKYKYEVHPATIIKMKEVLTWVVAI